MTNLRDAQAEGLCLRYPDNLGIHQSLNYDGAVAMLSRAVPLSHQTPYAWSFIDKPLEGQVFLLYMPQQSSFPLDGILYQDHEQRFSIPCGSNRELEVTEIKHGFIPGSSDTSAWRLRRRFRLHKGGHPQLVLVHYTRGPAAPILPALMNTPARAYPLRNITEPSIYVAGEKAGQKVYTGPQGPPVPPMHGGGAVAPQGMPFNPQGMVAHQNAAMETLERRRERERARERSGSSVPRPTRVEEDDSADETEHISTRTLASSRYKRNHDLMNEVFRYAAFGPKKAPTRPSPYSIFNKADLEAKAAKLVGEVDALNARAAERQSARSIADELSAEQRAAFETSDSMMEGITT